MCACVCVCVCVCVCNMKWLDSLLYIYYPHYKRFAYMKRLFFIFYFGFSSVIIFKSEIDIFDPIRYAFWAF